MGYAGGASHALFMLCRHTSITNTMVMLVFPPSMIQLGSARKQILSSDEMLLCDVYDHACCHSWCAVNFVKITCLVIGYPTSR